MGKEWQVIDVEKEVIVKVDKATFQQIKAQQVPQFKTLEQYRQQTGCCPYCGGPLSKGHVC